MKLNKQMFEAAAWTFLQAFLGTIAPAVAGAEIGDWGALVGVAAAGASAGVAAILSLVKSIAITKIKHTDEIFISEG